MIFTGGAPGGPFEDELWYLDDPGYNSEIADEAVAFFGEYLTHTKGRWKGKPFQLMPWQEHRVVRPLFGILRRQPDDEYPIGLRRYRKAYIEIPKKQGKSELLAGIGNKLLLADFEGDPEVHSAACDREQASIIHSVSGSMIRNNDVLNGRSKIIDSRKRIIGRTSDGAPNGYYSALSADVANKHGLNIHGCLFDELHAQPNSDLWDVLTEGSTVAREQPLIFAITTAGWDRESICWKMREYAVRILTGDIVDDEFLPVIYGMDPEDDWKSEDNWKAVNPSMYWMVDGEVDDGAGNMVPGKVPSHYGIFNLADFHKAFNEANELPYKQNTWRRLRLNQWTQQETAFIPMDRYDALDAPFTEAELAMLDGRQCYGGVDLSYVNDLTASCRVFPMDDGTFWCLWDYYIPDAEMHKRIVKDRMPYDVWTRDGWVSPTPGDTIDYNYVEGRWIQHRADCHINEVGFDPYNASQFVNDMQAEGFEMVVIRQTFLTLSPTTKELMRLILEGRIRFGGNPVSRAHANNLMVLEDNHGNIKPTKEKGRSKIDGMIALICALDCAVRHAGEHGPSVYEDEGVLVL